MRQKYSKGTVDQEYLEAQAAYDQAMQNFNNASAEFVDVAIFELNAAREKLQRVIKTPKCDSTGTPWWRKPIFCGIVDHSFGVTCTCNYTMEMSMGLECSQEVTAECGSSH